MPVINPVPTDPCTGKPIVPLQPPRIDGCINNGPFGAGSDPGWTKAWRYVFGNGTSFPDVAVQGIKDSTNLYLSFEVNNDVTYDDSDLIVLTFSPLDGNPAHDSRLLIYPNHTGVAEALNTTTPWQPREVDYWNNSSTWNNPAAKNTVPAGTTIAVSTVGAADSGNVSWFVEMALPLAGYNIPTSAPFNFGFFFDVVRVDGNSGTASEFYWPPVSSNSMGCTGSCFPDTSTPAVATWGFGTLDPAAACYGVSLQPSAITSNHNVDEIDATPGNSNTFTAVPQNNSVDGSGNPIKASAVTAKFSIADFGLPANFTPLPPGSPFAPVGPQDIPASSSASFTTPVWNITDPTEITNYTTNPDQCILVDLDSQAVGVTFVNKSVKENMWVETASTVMKKAKISAVGYPPQPSGQQQFDLHLLSHQEVCTPERTVKGQAATTTGDGGKGTVVSCLTWAMDGCRHTGRFITIANQKYETCEPVGAFGGIAQHTGTVAVAQWQNVFQGPNLTPPRDSKGVYKISIPQNTVATVTTQFTPQETVKKNCFGQVVSGATFLLLPGMFLIGLLLYRPGRSARRPQ